MSKLERALMREHLDGHHAVIRHQGCPACLAADRKAPAALTHRGRLPTELLHEYLAEPPHRLRRNGDGDG
jgi:hypothetical protein